MAVTSAAARSPLYAIFRHKLPVVAALLLLAGIGDSSAADFRFDFFEMPGMPFQGNIVQSPTNGLTEPFGTVNLGFGKLYPLITSATAPAFGLEVLFGPDGSNRFKTIRVVDVNGDGLVDIISGPYSCPGADPTDVARLFINQGDGTWMEDFGFAALGIDGHTETIVVADFDNDGFVDIYIPRYTRDYPGHGPCSSSPTTPPKAIKSVLLRNLGPFKANDGHTHFVDVTTPDVDLTDLKDNCCVTPEGAQAVDIDGDGLIDLYVAGHMLINLGGMHFQDYSREFGLPWCPYATPDGRPDCTVPASDQGPARPATVSEMISFDEGVKFVDWNNDGRLDIAWLNPYQGLRLFEQQRPNCKADGSQCTLSFRDAGSLITADTTSICGREGLNTYDLNNDGFEEFLVGGNDCDRTMLLTSDGIAISDTHSASIAPIGELNGVAFGDFDADGLMDIAQPIAGGLRTLLNRTDTTGFFFVVDVVGPDGRRNQQGRVLRVTPPHATGFGDPASVCPLRANTCMTRVVDGGSGYLGLSQYPLLIGTPDPGRHRAEIILPTIGGGRRDSSEVVKAAFEVAPGDYVRVYAPRHGEHRARVKICPLREMPGYSANPLSAGSTSLDSSSGRRDHRDGAVVLKHCDAMDQDL